MLWHQNLTVSHKLVVTDGVENNMEAIKLFLIPGGLITITWINVEEVRPDLFTIHAMFLRNIPVRSTATVSLLDVVATNEALSKPIATCTSTAMCLTGSSVDISSIFRYIDPRMSRWVYPRILARGTRENATQYLISSPPEEENNNSIPDHLRELSSEEALQRALSQFLGGAENNATTT